VIRRRICALLVLSAVALGPGQVLAQQPEPLNLGILVDDTGPDFAQVLDRLIDEITAVVGVDATVRFSSEDLRETDFDLVRARAMYQSLLDGTPDVILAFGPISAQAVTGQPEYPKPTILFGTINRDVIVIDEDRTSSGINNFTYVVTSQSYARDLATFRTLHAFENVGVVLPEDRVKVLSVKEALEQEAASSGTSYELISYRSPESLDPYLGTIDAVYLADSWGIPDDEIRAVAAKLIERRIPSFSGGRRQDVEMGIMATTHPEENLTQLFRRIALHVEAVANGENLSERPIFVDFAETLTVNVNTAQLVGVPLRYSLIATTEFVGDFVNSLSEQTYELADMVDEALAENLVIRVQRRDVDLAQQDVRTARSKYLPSISAQATGSAIDPSLAELSAGQNPQYSASGSLVLNQVIFSPGANANIDIQEKLLEAQQQNLRAAEQDIILDAANAFFNALIFKANVRIQTENLDVTKRNLRVAESNFLVGQSGRGDVLRLRSEVSRDMQALIESINQLERSFYAINQLLNNPVNREIDVADALVDGEPLSREGFGQLSALLDDPSTRVPLEDFLVAKALENAPELAALDFNLAAVDRTIALNGRQRFLPTIAAIAQYEQTLDQGGAGAPDPAAPTLDGYYTAGLSFSIPLFDSNLRNIDREAARLQRDQLRLNHESTVVAIEKSVRDVVLELINQLTNIELSGVSEEAAAESLELTQAAYSYGAVGVVDLLDAQTNLLQAQLARASAAYGFLSTGMALGRLVGHYFILSTDAENQDFFGGFRTFSGSPSR